MKTTHILAAVAATLFIIPTPGDAADVEAGSFGATNSTAESFFSGKVGMGLEDPAYPLEIRGNILRVANSGNANTQLIFDRYSTSNTRFPYINFRKSHSNAYNSKSTTQDGENLAQLIFRGVDLNDAFRVAARITIKQDGASGSSAVPGRMDFRTSSDTSDVIRMSIMPDGNVGVGTQSPSEQLHVSGAGRFDQGITYVAPLGDISMGIFTNAP